MLNCHLHAGQRKVFESQARIRVLACGARWGKDRLGIIDMISKAYAISHEPHRRFLVPGVLCWYIAPTNNLLRQSWSEAEFFLRGTGARFNRTSSRILLPNSIEIEFKSADKPGSLLARGLDIVVVTEAARMKKEAWEQALLTRLTSPGRGPFALGGIAMLNSTPEGRNWYYELYKRASADNTGYMQAFHFSSYDNPYINPEELNRQKELLPEPVFRQEYLAEFVDNSGAVFRRIDQSYKQYLYPEPVEGGKTYYIGIDWGRYGDATAISVIQYSHSKFRLVNFVNLKNMAYAEQLISIKSLLLPYIRLGRAKIIAEANSIGDPLIAQLREVLGVTISRFQTTTNSKREIVDNAVMLFEQGNIDLPAQIYQTGYFSSAVPELTDELLSYACRETSNGRAFSAPAGKHDDSVMSFCFALSGRTYSSNAPMHAIYDN